MKDVTVRRGAAAIALSGAIVGAASGSALGQEAGKLGVSMPTVQGPFFTALLYGIVDEAEAQGFEPIVLDAGGYANVDQQVSDMQNLLVQDVSAILIDPADDNAFVGVLMESEAQGVPVVASGAPLTGTNAAVSASHCDLGLAMAEGAVELLPEGGTVAALTGPAGAFWATERYRCFKEALDGSGIEIVAEQSSEPDAAVGLSIATDLLQRFPDVDLLYGADDTVGVGAARAVQSNDACDDIAVLTAILGETTEELMREGCIDYVVAQQTVVIGRESVRVAKALLDGEELEETSIIVPVVPVTPTTLDEVDVGAFRQPADWSL
ncbi:MAG: substrate-binding domain-containing protein [Azospirillaceae bacterium]